MGIFSEAVSAIAASCNFGVVIVAVAASLAGFANVRVVGAVVIAAVLGGWLFAADVAVPFGQFGGTVFHSIVLAGLVVAVFLFRRRVWLAAGLAAGAELLATFWWRPCVGRELAGVINGLGGFGPAGKMALYMFGLMLPAIGVASVAYLIAELSTKRTETPGH